MEEKEKESESLWDIVKFALITLAIVIPIRLYVAQPFIVSGTSMDPTFHDGQYLIVDEISYLLGTPHRGDVVIFKFPLDTSKYFIKRIIGLPGETVEVNSGSVYITKANGQKEQYKEPYINVSTPVNVTTKLGPDQYFVLGDNRAVSYDSRFWGPVDRKYLRGRAILRLLPLDKIGVLPGAYEPNN